MEGRGQLDFSGQTCWLCARLGGGRCGGHWLPRQGLGHAAKALLVRLPKVARGELSGPFLRPSPPSLRLELMGLLEVKIVSPAWSPNCPLGAAERQVPILILRQSYCFIVPIWGFIIIAANGLKKPFN